jgi:hypothetical protein
VQGQGETTTTLATTATVTTTTAGVAVGLPEAVERKRAAIHDAAARGDYDALEKLIPSSGFSYSFGGEVPGGATAYWRELEAQGERPLETLAKILELPFSLRQGLYVWPFAYGTPRGELTPYERGLLGQLVSSYAGDDYYGWRAGIRPDGSWQFFVSGD